MRLTPGDQPTGWQDRWRQIQRDAAAVCGPQSSTMTAENIRDATSRLYDFFIRAYHLKDLLKADQGVPTSGETIESAITARPDLALCADLTNTDKHVVLDRAPRSGKQPSFRQASASSDANGTWRLVVEIDVGSDVVDGCGLAHRIVSAWDSQLKEWGLI